MEIESDSLDDVLMYLYKELPARGISNKGSRGETIELLGVTFRISNPRSRLSRSENRGKSFSAIGELLWYLSGQNDLEFIKEYIPQYSSDADPDGTIYGGYGPRLLSMRDGINQIESVVELLTKKPGSRRAVIQLFNAEDIVSTHNEVPCTTTMQFFCRDNRLHMATTMRSNDIYRGLPHDVFCFTMLQEMIARTLGVDLGDYIHFVGSMHVYTSDIERCKVYMEEGYHKISEMPEMPAGKPFELVGPLLDCERRARAGEFLDPSELFPDPYWADIVRLLLAFWFSGIDERLDKLSSSLANPIYRPYVETRRAMKRRHNIPG